MSLKVIGAGNGRTGTLSMKLAMEQLGLGPCYHMYELMSAPERLPRWQDAFNGKPVDWEALFEGYRSTMDYPGFYFYKEIMTAFPEAKISYSLLGLARSGTKVPARRSTGPSPARCKNSTSCCACPSTPNCGGYCRFSRLWIISGMRSSKAALPTGILRSENLKN